MNMGDVLIIILGALIGGLPTLYIAVSAPAIIIWKIYRKVRYNKALYD